MTAPTDVVVERLSAEERLTLIAALWDSLSDAEVLVPEAQRAELMRRLASFDEDRADAMSWDDLKARLRSR